MLMLKLNNNKEILLKVLNLMSNMLLFYDLCFLAMAFGVLWNLGIDF